MDSGARSASLLNAKAEALGWGMRCHADLQFDHAELNTLRDVWRAKAAEGQGVPPRALFDARSLKPFLRNITIVEREDDAATGRGQYRIRLYGSSIVQRMGEQTGKYIHDVIPHDRLDRWTSGYDAVLAAQVPLRFISRFEIPQLSYYDGESFSAPVVGKNGEVNTILAATYFRVKEHLQVQTA